MVMASGVVSDVVCEMVGIADTVGQTGMLLDVCDLRTVYPTARGDVCAVRDVSLAVAPGEVLGLVGESGCGKSALMLSIMRLLPRPGRIAGGAVRLRGVDLLKMSPGEMREMRGREIAMVFQDPMTTLNPAYRVGDQISESLRVHKMTPSGACTGQPGRACPRSRLWQARRAREEERDYVIELMRRVGIPSPDHRCLEYPHQFSGGMQQRIMIAIALACKPRLLLADEPTTALDVTVQAQVLELMEDINREMGTAIVMVTHDLALAGDFCDNIAVMYAGQIVEWGPAEAIMEDPLHPYTRGLLVSMPRLGSRQPLRPIPGEVPDLTYRGSACAFVPRCRQRTDRCEIQDPPVQISAGRVIRCHAVQAETRKLAQHTARFGARDRVARDRVARDRGCASH